jgi:DNA invertase Pin-like site-specific DNA recombinase
LIKDYIGRTEEFKTAVVTEYTDDGISGGTTDREDYSRLMRDVENGAVNCIIVKDLSRIGRNMLDVDDLLMNFLVERNVRFISLNDNYDSFIHPLSVLELAFINLLNQDYLSDLVHKSASSRFIKVSRGEFVGRFAPFGYIKSKTDKNKLIVDGEAAGCVRLIFSLAAENRVMREIAEILNAQEIPTPSVYKRTRHDQGIWHTVDPEYHFWNDKMVWEILSDERYTGKAISKSYAMPEPGMFKTAGRAKEDWIVVPNAHEAIVTEDEYRRARDAMKRNIHGTLADNIFVTKVRCAACGHVMQRSRKYEPVFKCSTIKFTSHYPCTEQAISQADIETVVMESLKVHTDTLIDREEMKLAALNKSKESASEIEGKIRAERQAIKQLENSVTKIFTSLATGEMTTEAFVSKKEIINASIAKKKTAVESLEVRLTALTTGKTGIEAGIAELYSLRRLEKLDRSVVNLMVDRILVHGSKDIEIVWNGRYGV